MTDLANELIRATWRNPKKAWKLSTMQPRPLHVIRHAVANAKRFMLDSAMSGFLAELSTIPFLVSEERRHDVLDSLRHSSVLPFPKMFVQFDGLAFRRSLLHVKGGQGGRDFHGNKLLPPEQGVVPEIGWLIEQQPNGSIMMTEFFEVEDDIVTLPFAFLYRTDDVELRDTDTISVLAGAFAHGISGVYAPSIAIQYGQPLKQYPPDQMTLVEDDTVVPSKHYAVHYLVPEYGGVLRYLFAFLATLNNVPKIATEVRPQKSYMGGGQVRKYLDHTVLKLSLPARQTTTQLAKRLIAHARRGWHLVRPHWRVMHERLGGNYCATREAHIWGVIDTTGHATCKQCDARRIWITLPHGRGDPTISVRTHEYSVTHPV